MAQITLTPAEYVSENGKRRNMHMQTHKDLDNAPTVHLFGIGQRKGQLALLQMVKDAYNFRRDLLLDAEEEAAAARNARPFILPEDLNPTQQLLAYPSDPSRRIRDLFETQSQQATTPSDVAFEAQQAVMRLQNQAYQNNNLLEGDNSHQHVIPGNTMIRPRQESDVFSAGDAHGESEERPHFCKPSMFISNFHSVENDHSENQSQFCRPSMFTPSFRPIAKQASTVLGTGANTTRTPQGTAMNAVDPLEAAMEAGMVASKKIFPISSGKGKGKQITPQLPNAKYFLDLERCRLLLRNADVPAQNVFATWQNRQKHSAVPSWSARSTPRKGRASVQGELANDSGVMVEENDIGHGSLSTEQMIDCSVQAGWDMSIDDFAWQMISPERPQREPTSRITAQQNEGVLDQEIVQTPHMRAASTLLSLSPFKAVESNTIASH